MNDTLHIVFSTDDNFAPHCAVAMRTLLDHNAGVVFHILTEGLSEENRSRLQQVAGNQPIHFYVVESESLQGLPMPDNKNEKISIATYYRLFMPRLLPKEIEKVLYLDCDLVVCGSLQELWATDLTGKAMAAVYYPDCESMRRACRRLGMPDDAHYFNAGVLLINLAYWRENQFTERCLHFIAEGRYPIIQRDQDVLNAVAASETTPLPWRYNVMENELKLIKRQAVGDELVKIIENEKQKPVIVHFSFRLKPWEFGCRSPYRRVYRKTLKRTPYKGNKLHFSCRDFYEFWLKEVVIHPIITKIRRK